MASPERLEGLEMTGTVGLVGKSGCVVGEVIVPLLRNCETQRKA